MVTQQGNIYPVWYEFFRDFGNNAIESSIFNATDFNVAVGGEVTVKDTGINHDATTNFLANEHIDWTSSTENLSTSGTIASGSQTVTGNISLTGNVDGRDVASDGSKLDSIEALADVTDNANVRTALGTGVDTVSLFGNTLTLADDVAVSVTPNQDTGIIIINPQTSGASTFNAVVAYGAIATSYTAIVAQSGSSVEVATGALAGTTGSDTKLTVSSHTDGNVYIENRSGASITIGYTLLGA